MFLKMFILSFVEILLWINGFLMQCFIVFGFFERRFGLMLLESVRLGVIFFRILVRVIIKFGVLGFLVRVGEDVMILCILFGLVLVQWMMVKFLRLCLKRKGFLFNFLIMELIIFIVFLMLVCFFFLGFFLCFGQLKVQMVKLVLLSIEMSFLYFLLCFLRL